MMSTPLPSRTRPHRRSKPGYKSPSTIRHSKRRMRNFRTLKSIKLALPSQLEKINPISNEDFNLILKKHATERQIEMANIVEHFKIETKSEIDKLLLGFALPP
eukprot:GFUD01137412.1.p1 GENE.GFUD01137412.1~~GFUD01137412.1.p1  ORF type:complete len:103 (-),score=26.84 GFUD01137412.1:103-411(-)